MVPRSWRSSLESLRVQRLWLRCAGKLRPSSGGWSVGGGGEALEHTLDLLSGDCGVLERSEEDGVCLAADHGVQRVVCPGEMAHN